MENTINTYGPTTLFLYFHTSQLTISIIVKFIVKKLFTLLYGNSISGSQIIHTKNYLMSFYSTKTLRARLVYVFKNWKLLFENICGNTYGWKSALKCVKCCLKTENGCLKLQTKHPLKNPVPCFFLFFISWLFHRINFLFLL